METWKILEVGEEACKGATGVNVLRTKQSDRGCVFKAPELRAMLQIIIIFLIADLNTHIQQKNLNR